MREHRNLDVAPSALLTRRRFVVLAGAGIALTGCSRLQPSPGPTSPPTTGPGGPPGTWDAPVTWSSSSVPPRASDVARVEGEVVLDHDLMLSGLIIPVGASLTFAPDVSTRLTTTGNVVLEGTLTARPANALVTHEISFAGIDEAAFVGGGMDPMISDVGLWVMGDGTLDVAGSPKLAWARASGSVAPGAASIVLDADPIGWRAGDEIVITPTAPPTTPGHSLAYDRVAIASLSGRTVALAAAVGNAHPSVALPDGRVLGAEVLNLSRNVVIGGTPQGRSHVFVRTNHPHTIANVALHHMGPRQPDPVEPQFTTIVLGRYGLHLHMCGTTTSGSTVEGVVIRDSGSHAFVPHLSDGIRFTNCISHDTFEVPYWWDPRVDANTPSPPTNGVTYESCVASLVKTDPSFGGYRLNGFTMAAGSGNTCRDCVAVGVQGNITASGFEWREGVQSVWDFRECIAHNNAVNGILGWQNNQLTNLVQTFTAFHNGNAGISHGAYSNGYRYEDAVLSRNGGAAIDLHAVSCGNPQLTFARVLCDQGGLSDYTVRAQRHTLEAIGATRFEDCTFTGFRRAAVALTYTGSNGPSAADAIDLVDCSFAGNELWIESAVTPASVVRFQDPTHGTVAARPLGQPGTVRAEWNAAVEPVAAFAWSRRPPSAPMVGFPLLGQSRRSGRPIAWSLLPS